MNGKKALSDPLGHGRIGSVQRNLCLHSQRFLTECIENQKESFGMY